MPGTEYFGDAERKEVMDVLETGILFRYNHDHLRDNHWKSKDLESEVKKFTGAKHALAVSSGSTAVACMMAAAGIGYGDEVVVPPFTYVAPIEGVMLAGSLPIFAEVDENLCLTADSIRAVLTPKTKAVLLVHMCGGAAEMDEIVALCKEKNLILVEDAGQALGAFYKGKSVGLFGKCGAFSFDFFKITTAGEGGLFITNDDEAYNMADCFSDHGHDHIGDNRGMEQHPIVGFNFRMGELNAAVGLGQMKKINTIRDDKRRNKAYIKNIIAQAKGVTFRKHADESGDSGTFLNFFLPTQAKAQAFMDEFNAQGLGGCNYWFTNNFHFINQWDHVKNMTTAYKLPIHELGAPQDYNKLELPKSQEIIGRLISLGIRGTWTEAEMDDLGTKIKNIIDLINN